MANAEMLAWLSGFRDRMMSFGQPLLLRRTGETFTGILLAIPRADPHPDLGQDRRERCTAEFRRGYIVPLEIGDVLEQTRPFWRTGKQEESGDFPNPLWKVYDREDNPADFAVKYWVVKITSQDNQP